MNHPLRRQVIRRDGHLRVMDAGAGQHRADRYLSVGNIQVKLVAAPVLQVSMTILLCADVALPRQLAEHPGQFLMALPLNTRTALGNFGLGKSILEPMRAGTA